MTAEKIWNDPTFQFNELGPQAKNCSFVSLRDGKIEPNYRFYTHETSFAFLDTLSDGKVLNERLLFWAQLFHTFGKRKCQLLLVKDFVAKRSLKLSPCANSKVYDIDFPALEVKERDVTGVKEQEFDVRKHIDDKE